MSYFLFVFRYHHSDKEKVRHARHNQVEDSYQILDQIGSGSFSKVYRCVEKATGKQFAVKRIVKGNFDPSEEIEILLRHKNSDHILDLHEAYDGGSTFDLVTELCAGGELLTLLQKRTLSEQEAAELMFVITSAVSYLHR